MCLYRFLSQAGISLVTAPARDDDAALAVTAPVFFTADDVAPAVTARVFFTVTAGVFFTA